MKKALTVKLAREEIEFGPKASEYTNLIRRFPHHDHAGYFETVLVSEGSATHYVNDGVQHLEKGSIIYIRPTDVHSFKTADSSGFSMLNVGYTENDFLPVLHHLSIPLKAITAPALPIHIHLEQQTFEWLRNRLTILKEMFPSKHCRNMFRAIVGELYYPLLENKQIKHSASDDMPTWITDLDAMMSHKDNFILGASRIYQLCNYSQPHIIRSFKRYFNMTPTEYVNVKRMNYACELLLLHEYSISQICFMTGFNSIGHFYSVFKKIYNCTPIEYLRRE